ncbi:hypothetical protein EJ04DRAFT_526131 [Polyplosphaeria fusca]|uniref:Uncharacterized protein n=1 Tax=Polyplosphaeria fusca TaxID=682080 RepID=A0A9P4QRS1_9PLEO|nr:hypothetical protein EJ04DRAFT_526131 [Polyplosphaeria fusca]
MYLRSLFIFWGAFSTLSLATSFAASNASALISPPTTLTPSFLASNASAVKKLLPRKKQYPFCLSHWPCYHTCATSRVIGPMLDEASVRFGDFKDSKQRKLYEHERKILDALENSSSRSQTAKLERELRKVRNKIDKMDQEAANANHGGTVDENGDPDPDKDDGKPVLGTGGGDLVEREKAMAKENGDDEDGKSVLGTQNGGMQKRDKYKKVPMLLNVKEVKKRLEKLCKHKKVCGMKKHKFGCTTTGSSDKGFEGQVEALEREVLLQGEHGQGLWVKTLDGGIKILEQETEDHRKEREKKAKEEKKKKEKEAKHGHDKK